jgi:hypothetical protein
MGLFDDVENPGGQGDQTGQGDQSDQSGQTGEDSVVQDITKQGEKLADNETGGKYDSEIQDAGNMVDKEADQKLPNL